MYCTYKLNENARTNQNCYWSYNLWSNFVSCNKNEDVGLETYPQVAETSLYVNLSSVGLYNVWFKDGTTDIISANTIVNKIWDQVVESWNYDW